MEEYHFSFPQTDFVKTLLSQARTWDSRRSTVFYIRKNIVHQIQRMYTSLLQMDFYYGIGHPTLYHPETPFGSTGKAMHKNASTKDYLQDTYRHQI